MNRGWRGSIWSASILRLALALTPAGLLAQPAIDYLGIVNAASRMPSRLPGGSIARGSIFAISGQGLGPADAAAAPASDLETELAGVSVQVIQNDEIFDAIPLSVSDGKIEAIMPSDVSAGPASVTVAYQDETSDPVPVTIVDASFGIYSAAANGLGPGLIRNAPAEDAPLNSTQAPAAPGQTVALFGTGLGAAEADVAQAALLEPDLPVEIFVGGKPVANTPYRGRSDCCAGMDKIVFDVPADAPLGCYVPVQVRVAGTLVSNAVTMAIEPAGVACSDFAAQIPTGGGRIGVVALLRLAMLDDLDPMETLDFKTDAALGTFRDGTGTPGFNPLLALPPTGTCTAFGSVLNVTSLLAGSLEKSVSFGRDLDAGASLSLTGGQDTQTIGHQARAGYYGAVIGGSLPMLGVRATPLYLEPGIYQAFGTGGGDVGAFQAGIQVLPAVTWTNRDQIAPVDRARGLTVQWEGADASQEVAIFGANVNLPTAATGSFLCLAAPDRHSFTVPPQILQMLPPTGAQADQSLGAIFVGTAPAHHPGTFTANGLDAGFAISVSLSGRTVTFK